MKTIITAALILCSIGSFGQTGAFKLDSLRTGHAPNSITSITRVEPFFRFATQDNKPVMRISDLKPDSTYYIWIDTKAIKWTSDSTFILKRKP